MSVVEYSEKLVALALTLSRWVDHLSGLDRARRERLAAYTERIAATLARTATALNDLDRDPGNARSRRIAARELGRIRGYVEGMVGVLDRHLDGRKLAGVKKRLDRLTETDPDGLVTRLAEGIRIDHVVAAEGYMRAMADGIRTAPRARYPKSPGEAGRGEHLVDRRGGARQTGKART